MAEQYDVIVVGARCAGAATARLLAQQGCRTLLLDRAHFPSDMTMSTHLIWQGGTSILEQWGLLDAIRDSGCPGLSFGTLDLGAFALTGHPPSESASEAFAPRRHVLDSILVQAAVAEGAELRERFVVADVLWDGDRVAGVTGAVRGEEPEELRAALVIGADGRHSRIADAVFAERYHEVPPAAGTRFAYFSGVEAGLEFAAGERRMVFAWPTNDDQVIAGFIQPIEEFMQVRHDIEETALEEFDEWAPDLGRRLRAGQRVSPWHGGTVESFFRTASGPGWALVGDAGLTMDPITAAGITNALRGAQLLADAVHEGLSGRRALDEALADYGRKRDEASLAMYHFTEQMSQLAPADDDTLQLFDGLRNNPEDSNRYFGVFAQTVPVEEFFNPENLERIRAQGSAES